MTSAICCNSKKKAIQKHQNYIILLFMLTYTIAHRCNEDGSDSDLNAELWIVSRPTHGECFLNHALFVCSLSAVQSHSKWIICHSERIVSDQVTCRTSTGSIPAWTPGRTSSLPPSFSEFAPAAPVSVYNGLIHKCRTTNETRLFLSKKTQKHSYDRMKGFCICNTQKDKADETNKQNLLLLRRMTNEYVMLPPHLDPVEYIVDEIMKYLNDISTISTLLPISLKSICVSSHKWFVINIYPALLNFLLILLCRDANVTDDLPTAI